MRKLLKVDEHYETEDGQQAFEKTAETITVRYELTNIEGTVYELRIVNGILEEVVNVNWLYNEDGTIRYTNTNDEEELPF